MAGLRQTLLLLATIAILYLPRLAHGFVLQPAEKSQTLRMMSADFSKKGKILVLGGTGFLGQTICKRATLEGYSVTSLSRRGLPPDASSSASSVATSASSVANIEYRKGDARDKESIANILKEGGYCGMFRTLLDPLVEMVKLLTRTRRTVCLILLGIWH